MQPSWSTNEFGCDGPESSDGGANGWRSRHMRKLVDKAQEVKSAEGAETFKCEPRD